jgi:hypothetical protein
MAPFKSKALGFTALVLSGCGVYFSFAMTNLTYVDPDLQPQVRTVALVIGFLAFPCLALAWRCLDANGRTYVKLIALVNTIQLLWTLIFAA